MKNPDEPDITCKYGHYPYCPLCEHGGEIHEEWMHEDQTEWFCRLAEKEKQQHAQKQHSNSCR